MTTQPESKPVKYNALSGSQRLRLCKWVEANIESPNYIGMTREKLAEAAGAELGIHLTINNIASAEADTGLRFRPERKPRPKKIDRMAEAEHEITQLRKDMLAVANSVGALRAESEAMKTELFNLRSMVQRQQPIGSLFAPPSRIGAIASTINTPA